LKLRVFDLAFPKPLAASLAVFIDSILASDTEEPPLDRDYVAWARSCSARLREGEDDFVSLDECDVGMLYKDVLPDFLDSRIRAFEELLSQEAGKEPMKVVTGEMSDVAKLMSRLLRAMNFDMFDENWKGDRQ
jgi:hypothetical protein